jgi:hypothetical protein
VSLVLPGAATSIWSGSDKLGFNYIAFSGFTNLKEVSGGGIQIISARAFCGCTALTSADFPAAVTIGGYAFQDCTALTSVNLPAVTTIGGYAFQDCTALTSISLSASLTSIYLTSIFGCKNLTAITIASGNPNYSANGGMLLDKAGAALIAFPSASGTVNLPATVTTIGAFAFDGCTDLETVSLPAVTTIASAAFQGCTGLTSVSLPAVTSIGDYAFNQCTGLTSVSLPAVTTIDEAAFQDCTGLETVSLPAVTTIGSFAFGWCTALQTLSLPDLPPSLGSDVFAGTGPEGTLTIRIAGAGNTIGSYRKTWDVRQFTSANGNIERFGNDHKEIELIYD